MSSRRFNFDTDNTGHKFLGENCGRDGNTIGHCQPIGDGGSGMNDGSGKRGGGTFGHHVGNLSLNFL